MDQSPWYKQPWLWFLLAPLIAVFFAGFSMIYLAIVTNDGVVVDNFYKDGLAIKVRNQQDQMAIDLGLAGNLRINGQQLIFDLQGDLVEPPKQLLLQIIFPTKQAWDIEVTLTRSGNQYVGALSDTIMERRLLQIQPVQGETMWRLHGEAEFPLTTSVSLKPKTPQ